MLKLMKLTSIVPRQVRGLSKMKMASPHKHIHPVTKAPSPWDAHAAVYEQIWERSTSLWGLNALVLGQLPASPTPVRLLDVACGSGALAVAAAARGFDVTATDLSPGMIARLQAKLSTSGVAHKITPRVVDGQTLEDLSDASFDAVSSVFGLMMFPDRTAALHSALRVLVPGGRLLVTSWDANSVNIRMIQYVMANAQDKAEATPMESQRSTVIQPAVNRMLAAASFREELEENGFEDVTVHTLSNAMCFESGEELVRGVLDNSGFLSMAGHKTQESVQRCLLDFSKLILDGVDPFAEDSPTVAASFCSGEVETHPLWRKPFALHATGHIAVATKPN